MLEDDGKDATAVPFRAPRGAQENYGTGSSRSFAVGRSWSS